MVWPQNKSLSNWNYQSQRLLRLGFINTCNSNGSRNKGAHSKSYCAGIRVKNFVPTSEALQIMINFYQDKDIDMLKHVFILPNLAKTCLHKSRGTSLYPFTKAVKDLLEKNREYVVVILVSFLHAKHLLIKLFFQRPLTYANQLCGLMPANYTTYSMCQPLLIGLYTRWNHDSQTSRFTPRQNKIRSFEIMVMS